MSNILRFDQFKEGYVFEKNTIYRENISSLQYLDTRYEFEKVNEGLSQWWEGIEEYISDIFDGKFDITLEDALHFSADLGGIFGDLLVPGLGATIDVLHALAYFFQASQKEGEEKSEYIINGILTLIFAHPAMNIFQGSFSLVRKWFSGILSKISSVIRSMIKKEASDEITKKTTQEILDDYAKNPGALEWRISKKISDDLKEVEEWMANQLKKAGDTKSPESSKFVTWAKNVIELCLKPFRWMRDNIFSPLVSKFKATKVYKSGDLILGFPFKTIKFLAKNVVVRLLKIVFKHLPNLPKAKKIKMFDSIAESLSKAQKERGILRERRFSADGKFKIEDGDFIIYNFEKGADKCKVIRQGANTDEEMIKTLKTYFEEDFDKRLKRGDIELPEIKPTTTKSTLIDPKTGKPFEMTKSRKEIKEEVIKETKEKYSTYMSESMQIKEIDKSVLLAKQYENVERMIRNNTTWKAAGGIYKFYTSCFVKNQSEEQTSEESGSEVTLSDEQIQELEQQMEAGNFDPGEDSYEEVYDESTSEEQDQIAQPSDLGQLELENSSDYQSIIPASWDALETIYPQIDIPESISYSIPSYWIQKFQEDNSLEANGDLNLETLDLLGEKCTSQKARDYIESYVTRLSTKEMKDRKNKQSQIDQEDKEKEDKEKENNKKDEEKPKRGERLKRFGRFISGND